MGIDRKGMALALTGWLLVAAPALAGVKIHTWQSRGAQVYFVRAPQLPMVDVRVVFAAGSARDGKLPGLASLTSHLLRFGADGLNADRIAEITDDHGIQLSIGSDRDRAWVGFRSLSEPRRLNPALRLLGRLMARPDFNDADLARERRRFLLALRQQQQSPAAIARRRFYRAVYGNHPYAHDPSGNLKSIAAIRRADLQAFHRRYYVARNAIVVIVGKLNRRQARLLARRLLSRLPLGQAAPPLPAVQPLKQAKVIRVPFPSSQTHVLIGQPGTWRGDPDYYALYTGNHALGGSGLVSRISEEVREKRGMAYSAYSYFFPLQRPGPFVMGLQTRNDQADKAIAVLRKTLADFVERGITAAELEASKKNITGAYPLRIDSNGKITGYLAMIGFYRLPLDYLDRFNDHIRAITVDQVRSVFKRRIHPRRMVTVIVGGGMAHGQKKHAAKP